MKSNNRNFPYSGFVASWIIRIIEGFWFALVIFYFSDATYNRVTCRSFSGKNSLLAYFRYIGNCFAELYTFNDLHYTFACVIILFICLLRAIFSAEFVSAFHFAKSPSTKCNLKTLPAPAARNNNSGIWFYVFLSTVSFENAMQR